MKIIIVEIYANNDDELANELNSLGAHHIISVTMISSEGIPQYKVIYEQ